MSNHLEKELPRFSGFFIALLTINGWLYVISVLTSVLLPSNPLGDLIFLGASVFSVAFLLFNVQNKLDAFGVISGVLVLLFLYVVLTLNNFTFSGLKNVLAIFSICSLFVFFFLYGEAIFQSRLSSALILGTSLVALLAVEVSGMEKNISAGVQIYSVALITFVLTLRSRAKNMAFPLILFFPSSVAISFFSDFRSMAAYALVACAFYLSLLLVRGYIFRLALFISIVVYGLFIILFYVNFDTSALAQLINSYIISDSGRTALSGRNILWPVIIATIDMYPYFGLGTGAVPGDIFTTNWSSHNAYLQTALQVGYVGLIILVFGLYKIWMYVTNVNNRSPDVIFGSSIFALLLIHNITEVILLQNATVASIQAWMIVATSCGMVCREHLRSSWHKT